MTNLDQVHMGRAVSKSRAYDYLNIGFGFHNAPSWLPVYAVYYSTAFGMASGEVFSEDEFKKLFAKRAAK
jgi:hypothetical protein